MFYIIRAIFKYFGSEDFSEEVLRNNCIVTKLEFWNSEISKLHNPAKKILRN